MPEDLSVWEADDFLDYTEWKKVVQELDMTAPEIEGWLDACKKEAWVHEKLSKYENKDRNLAIARHFWRRSNSITAYKKQLEAELDKEIDAVDDIIRMVWDTSNKRNDIAAEYGRLLSSYGTVGLNWSRVNAAITERWSASGLSYIKNKAWKLAPNV